MGQNIKKIEVKMLRETEKIGKELLIENTEVVKAYDYYSVILLQFYRVSKLLKF